MTTIRELAIAIGLDVDEAKISRLESSIGRLRMGLQSVAQGVQTASDKIAPAMTGATKGLNVAGNAGQETANKINMVVPALSAVMGALSLKKLVSVGDEMQSLRARVGMLPQTVGDVGDAFDKVAEHANGSRSSIAAYATFYTRVGNASKGLVKDQEELLGITDTVSKALVVGGASATESASAMLQLSQALGSGRLQGDELRAIGESAPQYLDQLALHMGTTREKLKELGSQGKITSKDIIEATKKMAQYFDDKFKQMPMTVGQAMAIVGNKFSLAIDKINRKTHIINNVALMMVDAITKVEKKFDKFVETVGGADNALKLIAITVTALVLPALIKMLAVGVRFMASPYMLIAYAIMAILLLLNDWNDWMNDKPSSFSRLWKAVADGLRFIEENIVLIGSAAGIYLAGTLVMALQRVLTLIKAVKFAVMFDAAASGFTLLLSSVTKLFKPIGALWGLLVGVWGALTGITVETLILVGIWVGAFLLIAAAVVAVIYYWDEIKDAAGKAIDWIIEKWDAMIEKIKSAMAALPFFGDTKHTFDINKANLQNNPDMTAGMNKNRVVNNNTQNINVPPGTPQEQVDAIKKAGAAAAGNSGFFYGMNAYTP